MVRTPKRLWYVYTLQSATIQTNVEYIILWVYIATVSVKVLPAFGVDLNATTVFLNSAQLHRYYKTSPIIDSRKSYSFAMPQIAQGPSRHVCHTAVQLPHT